MEFEGKVVLITGSTSSIGFATAEAFLDAGAKVMINGSDQGRLDTALGRLARFGGRVDGYRADVRSSREVAGLVQATVTRAGGSTSW